MASYGLSCRFASFLNKNVPLPDSSQELNVAQIKAHLEVIQRPYHFTGFVLLECVQFGHSSAFHSHMSALTSCLL